MSRPLFSAIKSLPFAMARRGSIITSIAGSTCLRKASSHAIIPGYNSQVQFVDLPRKFCAEISDISMGLMVKKVAIASSEFISAVAKVREKIEGHGFLHLIRQ